MKKFKLVDIIISAVLIVGGLVLCIFRSFDANTVLLCYCVVGGWQVISMIIHQVDKQFAGKKTFRRRYHIFVLLLILFFVVMIVRRFCFNIDVSILLLPFLVLLGVASPVLALIYTSLCLQEWESMETPDGANKPSV